MLKLYIWTDIDSDLYSHGTAIAIALSKERAIELIACQWADKEEGNPKDYDWLKKQLTSKDPHVKEMGEWAFTDNGINV